MKKPKKIKLAEKSVRKTEQDEIISPRLEEEFRKFIRHHPAQRLSLNLRTLLLDFLMYDGSAEANYLRSLVIDLTGFSTCSKLFIKSIRKPDFLVVSMLFGNETTTFPQSGFPDNLNQRLFKSFASCNHAYTLD